MHTIHAITLCNDHTHRAIVDHTHIQTHKLSFNADVVDMDATLSPGPVTAPSLMK